MDVYDFISKNITLSQVQQIISTAGYSIADYQYSKRVDNDGFVVKGTKTMSLTSLRNAANKLKIKVEIYSGPSSDAAVRATSDAAGVPYSVEITMDAATVSALGSANYLLYGFKAVQSTNTGAPVVWFSTNNYEATTSISWTENYSAYVSLDQIIPNGQITASNSFAIDSLTPPETLQIQDAHGNGQVVDGGTAGAITIQNNSTTQYTCGISAPVSVNPSSAPSLLCAFNLYGSGNEDVIVPIEKVLLMFSTKPVNTGTVIEQAYSPGILIDLTADNSRTVSYDINQGWSWGGGSWAQSVSNSANLVPLLIDSSSAALTRRVLASKAKA